MVGETAHTEEINNTSSQWMYLIDKLVLFFCFSPMQSAMGGVEGWIGLDPQWKMMGGDGARFSFFWISGNKVWGPSPFITRGGSERRVPRPKQNLELVGGECLFVSRCCTENTFADRCVVGERGGLSLCCCCCGPLYLFLVEVCR